MALVLGIDAAWTKSRPSGVALRREERGSWRVVGVAQSYSAFVELASGAAVLATLEVQLWCGWQA
jgi:hypothetical protein